jgi:hypothetical protein
VDLVDGLDGVQVIDTRVETDLVHDGDTSLLGSGIKLLHGGRDLDILEGSEKMKDM